ncbi:hypothetical protein [Suttonella ornithocola]|uniref:Uncharacterized protein n=1 Tax=Suttonella ornithocola TaxID=279832 RepID=A0A380MT06_9GAMM|nr:hypothetical protein [Suttonella ornithocola]SUO95675.1 Uncharacterised protein [Suttonella ornithocola]
MKKLILSSLFIANSASDAASNMALPIDCQTVLNRMETLSQRLNQWSELNPNARAQSEVLQQSIEETRLELLQAWQNLQNDTQRSDFIRDCASKIAEIDRQIAKTEEEIATLSEPRR